MQDLSDGSGFGEGRSHVVLRGSGMVSGHGFYHQRIRDLVFYEFELVVRVQKKKNWCWDYKKCVHVG
jgi:hypothetical protein